METLFHFKTMSVLTCNHKALTSNDSKFNISKLKSVSLLLHFLGNHGGPELK